MVGLHTYMGGRDATSLFTGHTAYSRVRMGACKTDMPAAPPWLARALKKLHAFCWHAHMARTC